MNVNRFLKLCVTLILTTIACNLLTPTASKAPIEEAAPTSTVTAQPPKAPLALIGTEWSGALVIEIVDQNCMDIPGFSSFEDTITIDFEFAVQRRTLEGEGVAHHEPAFYTQSPECSLVKIECPDFELMVAGTHDDSVFDIYVGAPFAGWCRAQIQCPDDAGMVEYIPIISAIMSEMTLQIPIEDGASIEMSGVVPFECEPPTDYSYKLTIHLLP